MVFPGSRYFLSPLYKEPDTDALWAETQEPYRFARHPDTQIHIIKQGDTLWSLAAVYFRSLARAEAFWWVIADFQPDPIIDPTLELEPGRALYIPSPSVVRGQVLSETRREQDVLV